MKQGLESAAISLISQYDEVHCCSSKRVEALRVALKRSRWRQAGIALTGFFLGVACAAFAIGYALYLNAPL